MMLSLTALFAIFHAPSHEAKIGALGETARGGIAG